MANAKKKKSLIDSALGIFSDVRAGEGSHALLMLLSLFLLMVSYYILKTVREPLILAGGSAEPKSYAAAAQAGVLMLFVPAYGYLANRVDRPKLIAGTLIAFIACLQGFYLLGVSAEPNWLGVVYYIWVGIFSVATIAQFWSLANDLYNKDQGERLFPIVGIGMTAGAAVGSFVASVLFKGKIWGYDIGFLGDGLGPYALMQVAAGLLVTHLILTMMANASGSAQGPAPKPLEGPNGFLLVLTRPYIRLIAILLILLNIVNTTGEYMLGSVVVDTAGETITLQMEAQEATGEPFAETLAIEAGEVIPTREEIFDKRKGKWIGAFYGTCFFWVNVLAVLFQALFVSRLVKWFGITPLVFLLPIIAFGVYAGAAAGVGFIVLRWLKTAENSTDYSVMNSAKSMLWLPTDRNEKYKAKQAVDTFFVRLGDVISAGIVFVGANWLMLGNRGFGVVNLVVIAAWLGVSVLVVRRYKALAAETPSEETAA
jgi:AAA family ATP:ADP antiporter